MVLSKLNVPVILDTSVLWAPFDPPILFCFSSFCGGSSPTRETHRHARLVMDTGVNTVQSEYEDKIEVVSLFCPGSQRTP